MTPQAAPPKLSLEHLSEGAWRLEYEGANAVGLIDCMSIVDSLRTMQMRINDDGSMYLRATVEPKTEATLNLIVDLVRELRTGTPGRGSLPAQGSVASMLLRGEAVVVSSESANDSRRSIGGPPPSR